MDGLNLIYIKNIGKIEVIFFFIKFEVCGILVVMEGFLYLVCNVMWEF